MPVFGSVNPHGAISAMLGNSLLTVPRLFESTYTHVE